MTTYSDAIISLVETDVDDDYEGTGTNNRILGHMYHLKQYSKAADVEYDRLRKELEVPQPEETTEFQNDGKYSAVVQPRNGSRKLDEEAVLREMARLTHIIKLHTYEDAKESDSVREATVQLAKCYKYTKPSYAVSIVRSSNNE